MFSLVRPGRAKALILMWILLSDCAIFITLLPFQGVNGNVVCIHTQGVASLALGYALIGLSARPLCAGDC